MSSALSTYLIDVLGVSRFGIETEVSPASSLRAYKVIFLLQKALSPEAQELFLKMVEAMKLKREDFLVVEKMIPEDVQAQAYVAFDSQFSPQLSSLTDKFCVLTLSPEVLLQNPALKKQAWSDLQKVMKHISIVEVS